MTAWRGVALDAILIVVAIGLQVTPIDRDWIETTYANRIYATLVTTFVPLSNRVPFALGDLLTVVIVLGVIGWWTVRIRAARGRRWRTAALMSLHTAGVIAAITVWFDAAWALNYRRLPIAGRVAYDPQRVTPASVSAFSARIVRDLNRTAPLAHERLNESPAAMRGALERAFEPVVQRLGDRYEVAVTVPKTTLIDRWFAIAGIGGQYDPFAYETILNGDFLPFEIPMALAHEWGHVAGFGDESDANLIGALTCLRSDDPLVRYSGLFWTYSYLPQADRERLPLSPLVASDIKAARGRFLRYFNPHLYAMQWLAYDKYLRANRVSRGVVSYSLFVQVLVGTALDAEGLPLLR